MPMLQVNPPSPAPRVTATGCCPPFDPAPWSDQELVWKDKVFVKDHVTSFLHVPLNFGRKLKRDTALISAAQAQVEHPLTLSDEKSPWGADILIEVTKAVPGATMASLSGTFLTRVFEGPFRDASKWAEETRFWVANKGLVLEKLYFGYPTCPKCARAYGKNYVVLLAQVRANIPGLLKAPQAVG